MANCCKADQYKWCERHDVKYQDDDGNHYCIFHAPKELLNISINDFNQQVITEIDQQKKFNNRCDLSGTIFKGDIRGGPRKLDSRIRCKIRQA